MALVKKTNIVKAGANPVAIPVPAAPTPRRQASRSTVTKRQTIQERVAAATEQLASGLTEAAAATRQLRRSMEQIAAGAEEAAGASQEQAAAIKQIVTSLGTARSEADQAGKRSEVLSATLTDATSQILSSARSIERNAERQLGSVAVITELDQRARDIAEITQVVSRISDQTNLLALNAAIEAARAGEHGRGFAVVADEVRALAETSDSSAREVRQLASSMKDDVQRVVEALQKAAATASREAKGAASTVDALQARREDMAKIAAASKEILIATVDAEQASRQALVGVEQIASAAEEQSAGSGEAQAAVQEQARSLDQAQQAAQTLAALAESLRRGTGGAGAAEQIGSSAEELSATVQQISGAANEVMAAVDQIERVCKIQAAATHQASAAMAQIEKTAKLADASVRTAEGRVQDIDAALRTGRASVESLVDGVRRTLEDTRASIDTVTRLGVVGRQIEKIVDAIALVAVQTSMLAVSGSVEAARAGDSGRGFAIVSSDIRALAREAASNVERAKDTVRGVIDHIGLLKTGLQQVVAAAEVDVHTNRGVTTVLDQIATEIAAVRAGNQAIVAGAAQILAATVESAAGARQVAAAAEQASAAAREAATAATEQSRGAEDLAAAIEELAALAGELGDA